MRRTSPITLLLVLALASAGCETSTGNRLLGGLLAASSAASGNVSDAALYAAGANVLNSEAAHQDAMAAAIASRPQLSRPAYLPTSGPSVAPVEEDRVQVLDSRGPNNVITFFRDTEQTALTFVVWTDADGSGKFDGTDPQQHSDFHHLRRGRDGIAVQVSGSYSGRTRVLVRGPKGDIIARAELVGGNALGHYLGGDERGAFAVDVRLIDASDPQLKSTTLRWPVTYVE